MGNPTYTFDTKRLLQDAFGIVGFRTLPQSQRQNLPDVNGVPDLPEDALTTLSTLGTPILMPIFLGDDNEQITYYELNKDGSKTLVSVEGLTLPPATLIDFDRPKRIVRTEVMGRDGDVREYIGQGDWNITIRGVITNDDNPEQPPESFIKALNKICNIPVQIPIVNDMTRWLGITDIVIENVSFPALEGYIGAQPFVLDCTSDEIFEVKYKNSL